MPTLRHCGGGLISSKLNGFEVVSVNSPAKARFDIEMGRCGIFISCALVSDVVNADLFALFKKFCPDGLNIHITSSISHRTAVPQPDADVEVAEADGPGGIIKALVARRRTPEFGAA